MVPAEFVYDQHRTLSLPKGETEFDTYIVTTQVLDDGFRNLKSTSLGRICLAQKSYICTMNSISY